MMQSCAAMRCASLGWKTGARRACDASKMGAVEAQAAWRPARHSVCLQERSLSSWSRIQAARSPIPSYRASRPFHTSTPSLTPKPAPSVTLSDPVPEQFRSLMRLLTHPVVVLTAHDGTHPRAMTMSSFTSIALSPMPLVTFNVATPSRTLNALKSGPEFNIHILSADAHGAGLADKFTRGSADGVFDGVEYSNNGAAPMLEGYGVLYVLRCRLAKDDAPGGGLVRVRDHTIVVAEVLEMIPGAGGREFGLAYADRGYRRVGDMIVSH